MNHGGKGWGFKIRSYFMCNNTKGHATRTVFILAFLRLRSFGGTKERNQKLWAPTPGLMTGYPKMICLVRLILSEMHYPLGKTVSFVLLLKWLIWVGKQNKTTLAAIASFVHQAAEVYSWSLNFLACF